MPKNRLIGLITTYFLSISCIYAKLISLKYFEKSDSFPQLILDSIYLKSNLKYDIFTAPLTKIPLFNPVDGFLIQTNIGVRFKLNNPVLLSVRPRYAFHRKCFYGDAEFSFYFHKSKNSSTLLRVSGGNFLNQVNEPYRKNEQFISIINVFEGINPLLFIERKYFRLQMKHFFLENFNLFLSSEFADRSYLNIYPFKNFNFSKNKPMGNYDFKDKSFLQMLGFSYRSLFTISYKKGFKGFLNSESDFDFVQLELSQGFKLNEIARFDLSFFSGKFFNKDFIHFNDYYHFPTGRTLKSFNPVISTFRLLDYYNYSTNNYFHRIHLQLQTGHFLFTRLNILKKSKILENLFVNVAVTENLNPFIEIGYALDRVFKFFRMEIVTGRMDGNWLGPRIILGPVSI